MPPFVPTTGFNLHLRSVCSSERMVGDSKSALGVNDLDERIAWNNHGRTQAKFAASSVLPVPLNFATCG
jgi:hypothetical protein